MMEVVWIDTEGNQRHQLWSAKYATEIVQILHGCGIDAWLTEVDDCVGNSDDANN